MLQNYAGSMQQPH